MRKDPQSIDQVVADLNLRRGKRRIIQNFRSSVFGTTANNVLFCTGWDKPTATAQFGHRLGRANPGPGFMERRTLFAMSLRDRQDFAK
jgi:hypothetical protein